MTTTRPMMARLAILVALLAQLTPALAASAFWTVTEYWVRTEVTYTYTETATQSTCTSSSTCADAVELVTIDSSIGFTPKASPTAKAASSRVSTWKYSNYEQVNLYFNASDVASSDLVTTATTSKPTGKYYTFYAVSVTWTAPASCPTPLTIATHVVLDDLPGIPDGVKPHLTPYSTTTNYKTITYQSVPSSSITSVTYFLEPTAVPASMRNDSTMYDYYKVQDCLHPTDPPAWKKNSAGSSTIGYREMRVGVFAVGFAVLAVIML